MGSESDKSKWNARYKSKEAKTGSTTAAQVLLDYQYLLPESGKALDLACGKGANALLLAAKGLVVHAWDISDVAIQQLDQIAKEKSLKVYTQVRDVVAKPPSTNEFDVIVVSRFLQREIIPNIIQALIPRGLIFYQTFVENKISSVGPNNPNYLLKQNELLEYFLEFNIILYREEGVIGNMDWGIRNEAMLIAQKK